GFSILDFGLIPRINHVAGTTFEIRGQLAKPPFFLPILRLTPYRLQIEKSYLTRNLSDAYCPPSN
ncbi:hypothetical protein, partial [Microcoleus sp. D3_18a_C4]|uniref:hypothetical protein n=1 Tax=unclassified Microcoleus TaxID=2642155 RepID=UPI002FD6EF29